MASVERPVVVCFGDSNTFGADSESDARIPKACRWVTVLQRELGDAADVVPEGLNGRTTVIDDPQENPDYAGLGGQGMNGRRALLPCLHSHKPVRVCVIALGCNDLKRRFNCGPSDIALGLRALIADVRNSNAGCLIDASSGQYDLQRAGGAPAVVVVSVPLCRDTEANAAWGFEGCGDKSAATIAAQKALCEDGGVPFVDLGSVHETGSDGIHFPCSAGEAIGKAVAAKVAPLLLASPAHANM